MENKSTKRTNRLGRGLSALIPDISTEIDKKDIITIDLKNIYPNQDQPRRVFDEEKIKILSESIKNYGVLQPIVLKPDDKGKYMIIAGERRYRASKLARKSDIPAVIKDIPMKDICENVIYAIAKADFRNLYIFVDIRKPENIKRFIEKFPDTKTMYIDDGRELSEATESDHSVKDYDYDYYVMNNGSLDDLQKKVGSFVHEINTKGVNEMG